MKTIFAACFAVLLVGCQTPQARSKPVAYSGGDGSSLQSAVVIDGAGCREAGILAISRWLERSCPDAQGTRLSTTNSSGRHYELVQFTTLHGDARNLYFDTTDCYTKEK